jgi:enamine deaminase RidA (YjgF/YER057c/UK114 family)
MTSNVEHRVKEAGYSIPEAAVSLANYIAVTQLGNMLIVSGQLPMKDGKPHLQGALGRDVDIEGGKRAAALCVLNILAQLKLKVSDLDKLRCLRLGGFVNSTAEFRDHAMVMNGASDFIVKVMGENGRHARAAVGCSSLPLGVPVEVEATFALID